MTRADLAKRIAELVGPKVIEITNVQTGWPALASLRISTGWVPVALFVGPVTLSHRDRDDVERRYQNPGQNRPIEIPPGYLPLLIGLWENDEYIEVKRSLLVAADPVRREGRTTRFSVFVSVASLLTAATTGWSEDTTESGETMHCFRPSLLPIKAMAVIHKVDVPEPGVQLAIEAAGVELTTDVTAQAEAAERVRRVTSTLVRDARFSRRVIEAYGELCAMCGLDLGLVEGAHIYPAAAPGSPDEPWNGLSLCANHHLAFDRHLVWVDPVSRRIRLHPNVQAQRRTSAAVETLVSGTATVLADPKPISLRPRDNMFEQRYEYFGDRYTWA